tara:strand:- start:721 stop:1002 length:282 start_codon:yes stop_codon:yes gene_type:complete
VSKVKCIRLDTGEVLIGFVERTILGNYKIIDAQICLTNTEDGKYEVNLAPWIPFAKEYTFILNSDLVQTVFEPRPQLETNFKVATGNKVRGSK